MINLTSDQRRRGGQNGKPGKRKDLGEFAADFPMGSQRKPKRMGRPPIYRPPEWCACRWIKDIDAMGCWSLVRYSFIGEEFCRSLCNFYDR